MMMADTMEAVRIVQPIVEHQLQSVRLGKLCEIKAPDHFKKLNKSNSPENSIFLPSYIKPMILQL